MYPSSNHYGSDHGFPGSPQLHAIAAAGATGSFQPAGQGADHSIPPQDGSSGSRGAGDESSAAEEGRGAEEDGREGGDRRRPEADSSVAPLQSTQQGTQGGLTGGGERLVPNLTPRPSGVSAETRMQLQEALLQLLVQRAQQRQREQHAATNGERQGQQTERVRTEEQQQQLQLDEQLQAVQRVVDAAGTEPLVLHPMRLRYESHVTFVHALNSVFLALFCVLLLVKLHPHGSYDNILWWQCFIPLFLGSTLLLQLHTILLVYRDQAMMLQIGPPPSSTASTSIHVQFSALKMIRTRTYTCDHIMSAIDHAGFLAAELAFVAMLSEGKGEVVWPVRLVFLPLWTAWALGFVVHLFKFSSDRQAVCVRDILYISLLLVALKVDGTSQHSWSSAFILPFIWFVLAFILAVLLGIFLLCDRCRSRPVPLMGLGPLGFWLLLLFQAPLFAAMLHLIDWLDSDQQYNAAKEILGPAIAGFALMSIALGLIGRGLQTKEQVRRRLLASGLVWTNEAVARNLGIFEQEAAERRADAMTDEELAETVKQMMAGKVQPKQLQRVGQALYKRVPDREEEQQQPQQQHQEPQGGTGSVHGGRGGGSEGGTSVEAGPPSAAAALPAPDTSANPSASVLASAAGTAAAPSPATLTASPVNGVHLQDSTQCEPAAASIEMGVLPGHQQPNRWGSKRQYRRSSSSSSSSGGSGSGSGSSSPARPRLHAAAGHPPQAANAMHAAANAVQPDDGGASVGEKRRRGERGPEFSDRDMVLLGLPGETEPRSVLLPNSTSMPPPELEALSGWYNRSGSVKRLAAAGLSDRKGINGNGRSTQTSLPLRSPAGDSWAVSDEAQLVMDHPLNAQSPRPGASQTQHTVTLPHTEHSDAPACNAQSPRPGASHSTHLQGQSSSGDCSGSLLDPQAQQQVLQYSPPDHPCHQTDQESAPHEDPENHAHQSNLLQQQQGQQLEGMGNKFASRRHERPLDSRNDMVKITVLDPVGKPEMGGSSSYSSNRDNSHAVSIEVDRLRDSAGGAAATAAAVDAQVTLGEELSRAGDSEAIRACESLGTSRCGMGAPEGQDTHEASRLASDSALGSLNTSGGVTAGSIGLPAPETVASEQAGIRTGMPHTRPPSGTAGLQEAAPQATEAGGDASAQGCHPGNVSASAAQPADETEGTARDPHTGSPPQQQSIPLAPPAPPPLPTDGADTRASTARDGGSYSCSASRDHLASLHDDHISQPEHTLAAAGPRGPTSLSASTSRLASLSDNHNDLYLSASIAQRSGRSASLNESLSRLANLLDRHSHPARIIPTGTAAPTGPAGLAPLPPQPPVPQLPMLQPGPASFSHRGDHQASQPSGNTSLSHRADVAQQRRTVPASFSGSRARLASFLLEGQRMPGLGWGRRSEGGRQLRAGVGGEGRGGVGAGAGGGLLELLGVAHDGVAGASASARSSRRAQDEEAPPLPSPPTPPTDPDDHSCIICCSDEQPACCVFLECGHGGLCTRCARLILVRPPSKCPTCRSNIHQVVELESIPPIGHTARVKQTSP